MRASLIQQVAPYLTTLVNGVGWQSGFPRTVTNRDIQALIERSGGEPRLAAVQDVSCDLKVFTSYLKALQPDQLTTQGGLEFADRHTSIDAPYFDGPGGILVSTTDILPTELRKSGSHFDSSHEPS